MSDKPTLVKKSAKILAKRPTPIKTVANRYDAIVAKKNAHKRKQDDLEAEKKALELENAKEKKEEIQFYHDVLENVLDSMMELVKKSPSAVDEKILMGLKTKIEKAGDVVHKALSDRERIDPKSLLLAFTPLSAIESKVTAKIVRKKELTRLGLSLSDYGD